MIEDLEKFRRDPSVDMDYIRQELTAPAADTEPTMPLPTAQVASAVKKHTGELRREREEEEEPPAGIRSLLPSSPGSLPRRCCWLCCCSS